MEALTGKTALVTGAGKGIGRAVAVALAQEGVNVALLARTESQLREVAAEIEKLGVKAVVVTADVADRTSVEAAVGQVLEALGTIDILINNAGIGTFAKLVDMDPAEWEKIIQVNLMGTY